jgi:hypothetical protein
MDWSTYTQLLDELAQARRDAYESAPRTTPAHVDSAIFLAMMQALNQYMKDHPTPVLSALTPDTAVSGDPDFELSCDGTDFTADCVIVFGSVDEPTTFVSDTEVTTVVKPSLFAPAIVPVTVRNGANSSNPVDFTFTAPAVVEKASPDTEETSSEEESTEEEAHSSTRSKHGRRK